MAASPKAAFIRQHASPLSLWDEEDLEQLTVDERALRQFIEQLEAMA